MGPLRLQLVFSHDPLRQAAPSSPALPFRSGGPRPAGAQRRELGGSHGDSMGISRDLNGDQWVWSHGFCGVLILLMFFFLDGTSSYWYLYGCIIIVSPFWMVKSCWIMIFTNLPGTFPRQIGKDPTAPGLGELQGEVPQWLGGYTIYWVTKHRP